MFGWIKGIFDSHGAGHATRVSADTLERADALMAAGTEELEGLNFKTAIEAHLKWKARLRAVIDGTSEEKLDPQIVGMDNQCVLGKWLHGAGGDKFGAYPRFKTLCTEHAKFHRSAAAVMLLAQQNRQQDAMKEIESGGYHDISMNVTGELASLFVEIGSK